VKQGKQKEKNEKVDVAPVWLALGCGAGERGGRSEQDRTRSEIAISRGLEYLEI